MQPLCSENALKIQKANSTIWLFECEHKSVQHEGEILIDGEVSTALVKMSMMVINDYRGVIL